MISISARMLIAIVVPIAVMPAVVGMVAPAALWLVVSATVVVAPRRERATGERQ